MRGARPVGDNHMSVHIQNAAAQQVFQEFNTTLMTAFGDTPSVWTEYGIEVPSSSLKTLHAWLVDQEQVTEWKGSRILADMGTLVWEVINRDWQIGWKFHERQIRDDLKGLTQLAIMKARSYGQKWKNHEDKLCADTVQAGVSKECYDGQYFFDTDHPVDVYGITSGTFANLFTGRGLTLANFDFGLQQLKQMKLPDGSPWVGPGSKIKLLHETTNNLRAQQLCKEAWFSPSAAFGLSGTSGASTNPFVGQAENIENQWMNDEPGVWYLAAEVYGIKPIMFQRRQDVETDEQGPGSAIYFEKKEYHIGQDARYEASYTHPQLMLRFEP